MHIHYPILSSARRVISHWALLSWLLLLITGSANLGYAQPSGTVFQGPLVITKGGTYSGNWESQDSNTPAVSVNTAEPVIIENAIIRSRGILIRAHHLDNNVTVRNTRGYGLTPNQDNIRQGRFLDVNNFKNIRLEHNYLDHTSGIYLAAYRGNQTTSETVKILYNQAVNIDGRTRNGGKEFVQFVQFNSVRRIRGAEIAWNQVINEPYKSAVEENINMYKSNGTADNPIIIHNNYIQGAYPADPATGTGYGGGGINMGDGPSTNLEESSGFVKAYNNQIVSTAQQGICVTAGHDMEFYNNRIIAAGYLEDGTYVRAQNVGIYIATGTEDGHFFNNRAHDNVIGYVNRNTNGAHQRNDQWLPHAVEPHRYDLNTELPNPITHETEKAEFVSWQAKLRANGVVVGPTAGTPAPTPPAPAPAVPTLSPTGDLVSGGTYKLTHKGTTQVLEVASNSSAPGIDVRQGNDTGGDTQRWIISREGDGSYKITNKATNQLLDVANNSSSAGANVHQWNDNGSSAQRWLISREGDGSYKLLHQGTTQALDVDNNSSSAGANVQQWDDNGSSAQRWVFELAGQQPAPPPTTTRSFYRAINLGGGAVTLDGHNWEAGAGATGLHVQGQSGYFSNQSVGLNPATDDARTSIIRSSVWGQNMSIDLTVPNGSYEVYAYLWEDNNAATYSLSLEGQTVLSNHNSGAAGTWQRIGPFAATISDGAISLRASGGDANISGLEIWQPAAAAAVAATSSQASRRTSTPAAAADLQAYPNPSRGQATLAFSAATAQRVTVYVHDQHGRLVTLLTVPAPAGRTDFRLPTTLVPGLYHLRARIDGQPQQFTLQVE